MRKYFTKCAILHTGGCFLENSLYISNGLATQDGSYFFHMKVNIYLFMDDE